MRLLLGGSPCTHWSIAQSRHREVKPEGLGWELFRNYLISKERYRPDYFLYENNKSMAPAIRAQISAELGVEPIVIGSGLTMNRLGLQDLHAAAEDGNYNILLIPSLTHLGRDADKVTKYWRQLRDLGVSIHAADCGEVDLSLDMMLSWNN